MLKFLQNIIFTKFVTICKIFLVTVSDRGLHPSGSIFFELYCSDGISVAVVGNMLAGLHWRRDGRLGSGLGLL